MGNEKGYEYYEYKRYQNIMGGRRRRKLIQVSWIFN
jgi:hypothetical protein